MVKDSRLTKPPEHYPYGIIREWSDENRLVIITTEGNVAREAVDEWAALVIRTVEEWPADQPIFIMHDLSLRRQEFTPYSQQRAEDTYKVVPEGKDVFIAVVLPEGFVNQIISIFQRRRKGSNGNIRERVFTSCGEAMDWLRETMSGSPGSDLL